MTPRSAALLPLALAGLAGCGGGDDQPPPARAPVAVVPRPPSPPDSLCPRDGRWRDCHLVDRILKAGLAFTPTGDTVRQPFLAVPGVEYAIGAQTRVYAFVYADSAAIDRDLARMETVTVRPVADTTSPWPGVPTAIRSANLLVVLLSDNARRIERVRLAITAGPPQPDPGDPR